MRIRTGPVPAENRSLDGWRRADAESERNEALFGDSGLRPENNHTAEYRFGCDGGVGWRCRMRRHAYLARPRFILTRMVMSGEGQR